MPFFCVSLVGLYSCPAYFRLHLCQSICMCRFIKFPIECAKIANTVTKLMANGRESIFCSVLSTAKYNICSFIYSWFDAIVVKIVHLRCYRFYQNSYTYRMTFWICFCTLFILVWVAKSMRISEIHGTLLAQPSFQRPQKWAWSISWRRVWRMFGRCLLFFIFILPFV